MKRTRKWKFLEQEAQRLAGLGLSASEIARQMGTVTKATVNRWFATGKLIRPKRPASPASVTASAADWAKAMRAEYDLNATDDQLVRLGEMALCDALNASLSASTRAVASGRFQSIAKQLAIVARRDDAKPAEAPKKPVRQIERATVDPRKVLMAVK